MTKIFFRLFNTLSRTQEVLTPLVDPEVRIYTCGPTVYDTPHIGNYRTYIFEDILVKSLRFAGYSPRRVMNITDVGHLTSDADEGEDKLEVGARREGLSAWDIAAKYEAYFFEDLEKLNIERPAELVKATATIPEQIAFIQELEGKGYTYTTSDGVYFDSSRVADYGKLARLDLEGLQEGQRIEMGEKRQKTDFALWKFSHTPGERHMEWESPWGIGFPGWHIECSAIIKETLGETIDIHCGGTDHIPVHHTNEIAQSEALTGNPLANIWLHSEFLLVDGGKMSKSLGNMYTVADLVDKGYDSLAFRMYCLTAGYRSKLNFTWEGLDAAAQQLKRMRAAYTEGGATPSEALAPYFVEFTEALADDLNTPKALAVVWDVLGSTLSQSEKNHFLTQIDQVFSLGLTQSAGDVPQAIQELLNQREAARQAQDWTRSDQLRAEIQQAGYQVLDTPEGQKIGK